MSVLHKFDALKNLSAIAPPILFVNGDRDAGMVRGEPQFLAAARQGRTHRFAKCGHGVSMLRSAEFAALVNQFAAAVFD
jgi:pimeloyl-ACP methyl ester carboxylesterase